MNKYAAVAAVAVMLGIGGCASIGHTQGAPASAATQEAATADPIGSRDDLVRVVQAGWVGNDVPDTQWIRTEAMLVCKRDIGGIAVPAVTSRNQALVTEAARAHFCEQ